MAIGDCGTDIFALRRPPLSEEAVTVPSKVVSHNVQSAAITLPGQLADIELTTSPHFS